MTELEFKIDVSERLSRLEVLVILLAASVWGGTAYMVITAGR
jgi:hypothetical protein